MIRVRPKMVMSIHVVNVKERETKKSLNIDTTTGEDEERAEL